MARVRDLPLPVDTATLRRLAVEASADPRTVARAIRGEPVRGMAAHRIRRVLVANGYPVADSLSEAS